MLTGAGARAGAAGWKNQNRPEAFPNSQIFGPDTLDKSEEDEMGSSNTFILLQFLGFVMEELLLGHMNEYKADGNGCDL